MISWRLLGLLSMAIIVVAAAVPLLGKPLDWQDSVSHSWVGSRRKWFVLAVIMSLAGAGLCASLAFWLVPHYQLASVTYVIIGLAYAAFLAVAWIPMTERPGEHSFLHGHFLGGSVMVTLAVGAMACMVWFGTGVPTPARIVCFVAMILAAGWPLLFFSRLRRFFLVGESLIALAFSVGVVLLFLG